MSWLKRHEPIILSQTSAIPYVISEKGVFLCFDNLYSEQCDNIEHFIQFTAYKNDFIKQSTNHFRLKDFPKIIPFEEIVQLDDVIVEGRIIKQASAESESDPLKILVVHSSHLLSLVDEEFQHFVEDLDIYNKSFLLTGEDIDPQTRLLEDNMKIIHHRGWYSTAVSIADKICSLPNRKYCWIQSLPGLSITVCGLQTSEEMNQVHESMDNIGIQNKEISWG